MSKDLLSAVKRKDLLTAIVISVVASAGFVGILAMQNPYNTASDETIMKMKGHLTLVLKDEFGNVKDYREFDNIIVKNGQEIVGVRVFNSNFTLTGIATVTNIRIGTGATGELITDTGLVTACATTKTESAPIINRQGTGASSKVTLSETWTAGECTSTLTESGLFDAASGGNMFARKTFAGIAKGAGDSLTVTWEVTLS